MIVNCCLWFFLLFCHSMQHCTCGMLFLFCSFLFSSLCIAHTAHVYFSPGINDKKVPFSCYHFSPGIEDARYILPVAACMLVLHRLIVVCLFFLLFANFFGSCVIEPTQRSFYLPNSAFLFHLCHNCSPDTRFIVVLTNARFIVVLCHLHPLFLPDWPPQTSLFCFCHCRLPANDYLSTSPIFVICGLA